VDPSSSALSFGAACSFEEGRRSLGTTETFGTSTCGRTDDEASSSLPRRDAHKASGVGEEQRPVAGADGEVVGEDEVVVAVAVMVLGAGAALRHYEEEAGSLSSTNAARKAAASPASAKRMRLITCPLRVSTNLVHSPFDQRASSAQQ